ETEEQGKQRDAAHSHTPTERLHLNIEKELTHSQKVAKSLVSELENLHLNEESQILNPEGHEDFGPSPVLVSRRFDDRWEGEDEEPVKDSWEADDRWEGEDEEPVKVKDSWEADDRWEGEDEEPVKVKDSWEAEETKKKSAKHGVSKPKTRKRKTPEQKIAEKESSSKMGSELHSIGFTPGSVLRAMKGIQASKALNPDGILSFSLKELRYELCEPLAILFQISFEQCKFPTSWKLSHVTSIFKGKGKRSDKENYCPISLTSPFLKIMERIIVEKSQSHFELNNLFSDHQHGFRKNRSTVSQLAFDRISLRKLIHCLEVYGIKEQLKNWLSAYLNDRKITVKVAETLSTWIDSTRGVPHGSVLGPVLFVLYIGICINAISQTDFGLFADDTKLLGEASASSQIQSDLDTLTEKLEEWQLLPNVAKCYVVHLGRQKVLIQIERPQLEYATVICLPYLKKDIDRIERVQKRIVKGLQGFRNLP
ncbi:hypothetical protein QYM36_013554, partial [Artemia franciscana]